MTLTELHPVADVDGHGRDAYRASAAATSPEFTEGWALVVVALCADSSSLPGWEIVTDVTNGVSESLKRLTVACPDGKKVLGTGAKISRNNGQIGLQVARTDAAGVLTPLKPTRTPTASRAPGNSAPSPSAPPRPAAIRS